MFIYQSGALNVCIALAEDNELSLDSLPGRVQVESTVVCFPIN